ncbi:hypothetical protein BH20ACT13_BH20ACT13_10790 [soil metagenome]
MTGGAAQTSRKRSLTGSAVLTGVVTLLVFGSAPGASYGDSHDGPIGSSLPPALESSAGPAIYVSPKGSDRGPGTLTRPKRTIQSALDRARQGQRILVRKGVYEESLQMERSGTRDAPITLAAYRGERVVVRPRPRGRDTYALHVKAPFIRIKGLVLEGASGTSSANFFLDEGASNVELRGNEIRKGQDQGIVTDSQTSNVQIIGNIVHDNGAGLPGQHQSHGMYVNGTRRLIVNNVVYNHPDGFGIHIYPKNDGTIVAGNTVAFNELGGMVVGGSDVSNITIRNNIFAYNGRYGIAVTDDAEGTRIDTNLLYRNTSGDIRSKADGVTIGENTTAPPRFAGGRVRNFHLTRGSAAIDQALAAYAQVVDLDGVIRPQGRAPDIGAFEWTRK